MKIFWLPRDIITSVIQKDWEERMNGGGFTKNHPENRSSQSSSGNTTGKESCPPLLLDEVSEIMIS